MKKIIKLVIKPLIILAVILLSFFYISGNYSFPPSQKISSIRAVYVQNPLQILSSSKELLKIKDAGFNAVVISPPVIACNGRTWSIPFTYTATGYTIRKIHEAGLAVIIAPNLINLERNPEVWKTRLARDFLINSYQRWAAFAEKSNSECLLINPSSYRVFKEDREDFLLETLEECRIFFKGKIGYHHQPLLSKTGSDIDIELKCLEGSMTGKNRGMVLPEVKGFDFVVIDLAPPAETRNLELFTVDASEIVGILEKSSSRKGWGTLVFNIINLPVQSADKLALDVPVVTQEQQKIYLEKMLSFISRKSLDFIVYDWSSRECGVRNNSLLNTVELPNGSNAGKENN